MESALHVVNMSLFFPVSLLPFTLFTLFKSELYGRKQFFSNCSSHSLLTDTLETPMKTNCCQVRCWRSQGLLLYFQRGYCWSHFQEGESSQGQQDFSQANPMWQDLGEPQFRVSTTPFTSVSTERWPARISEPQQWREYEFWALTWEGNQALRFQLLKRAAKWQLLAPVSEIQWPKEAN